MNIRTAAFSSYSRLYALNREIGELGININGVMESMQEMAAFLTCPGCRRLIERCDSTIFVFPCAHAYHKNGCWRNGDRCTLCPRG